MLQQAMDMREEAEALYDFVKTPDQSDWDKPTPFKKWTVFDVIGHLHFFDWVALQSMKSEDDFTKVANEIVEAMIGGVDLATFTREKLGPKQPDELLGMWRDCYLEMCDFADKADPELRLKWFGPDMGVKMFITARQMETWAHGQDIYDLARAERTHKDRIKNIAVIGVKTFGWTFINRGLEVPAEMPHVKVTAPSGEVWEWNETNQGDRVEGTAVDFCRVVTQGRNVADTDLRVVGETAAKWMSIAQCFAGGPVDPPKPGERAWERRSK